MPSDPKIPGVVQPADQSAYVYSDAQVAEVTGGHAIFDLPPIEDTQHPPVVVLSERMQRGLAKYQLLPQVNHPLWPTPQAFAARRGALPPPPQSFLHRLQPGHPGARRLLQLIDSVAALKMRYDRLPNDEERQRHGIARMQALWERTKTFLAGLDRSEWEGSSHQWQAQAMDVAEMQFTASSLQYVLDQGGLLSPEAASSSRLPSFLSYKLSTFQHQLERLGHYDLADLAGSLLALVLGIRLLEEGGQVDNKTIRDLQKNRVELVNEFGRLLQDPQSVSIEAVQGMTLSLRAAIAMYLKMPPRAEPVGEDYFGIPASSLERGADIFDDVEGSTGGGGSPEGGIKAFNPTPIGDPLSPSATIFEFPRLGIAIEETVGNTRRRLQPAPADWIRSKRRHWRQPQAAGLRRSANTRLVAHPAIHGLFSVSAAASMARASVIRGPNFALRTVLAK